MDRRPCGSSLTKKLVVCQVYLSVILFGIAAYLYSRVLYCQSQIYNIATFQLALYSCGDLCQNHPFDYDRSTCCTDANLTQCTAKYVCLNQIIKIFDNKIGLYQILIFSLVSLIPVLILLHILIRCFCRSRFFVNYLRRRRRNQEGAQRSLLMKGLQSFLFKDQQNQCSICLELFHKQKAIVLQCGHVFHNHCIREWALTKNTCPVCRTKQ